MERVKKGKIYHQKGKIYQQDVFSQWTPGRLKLLDVIIIKSLNTCNNQLASSIVLDDVKEESYDLCCFIHIKTN